jgi:hypothetical protein
MLDTVMAPDRRRAVEGWYVYAVASADVAAAVAGRRGVGGSSVNVISAGSLTAVVSQLSPAETGWATTSTDQLPMASSPGGDGLGGGPAGDAEGLLVDALRTHEQVVEGVLAAGAVVPLRFGALYPTERHVRAMLEREDRAWSAALARVHGCAEWSVRVTWASAAASEAVGLRSRTDEPGPVLPPGRAYLAGRVAERHVRQETALLREACASGVHEQLALAAAEAVRHEARTFPGDGGRDVVLQGAYLVRREDEGLFAAQLDAQLERGARLGLRAEMTGPWPAYHFAQLELYPGDEG